VTIKERLHQLVDELDDERATEVLAFALRASVRSAEPPNGSILATEPGVDVDSESLWQVARPVTGDDPLWSIVGVIDGDGPTDVSSSKHRYLANLYGDLHDN
jgi:hypothetical protein